MASDGGQDTGLPFGLNTQHSVILPSCMLASTKCLSSVSAEHVIAVTARFPVVKLPRYIALLKRSIYGQLTLR